MIKTEHNPDLALQLKRIIETFAYGISEVDHFVGNSLDCLMRFCIHLCAGLLEIHKLPTANYLVVWVASGDNGSKIFYGTQKTTR